MLKEFLMLLVVVLVFVIALVLAFFLLVKLWEFCYNIRFGELLRFIGTFSIVLTFVFTYFKLFGYIVDDTFSCMSNRNRNLLVDSYNENTSDIYNVIMWSENCVKLQKNGEIFEVRDKGVIEECKDKKSVNIKLD